VLLANHHIRFLVKIKEKKICLPKFFIRQSFMNLNNAYIQPEGKEDAKKEEFC
jgi:hypothetical protein